ncbi:LysR substrate-binding domain-containing protein [Sandaracinobacter sp. RS1-74]|uniref:LysR substrate-binding domain-containing protein n=1 Tax=Sandaracinobacteroides sayramensis TaxID=2913411 RepID=UPI001ED9E41E|nr:LysR substrate-binding domain-containing protein [Sandaracinobacteroides sayramensis]MCG2840607.1 LysR substrate-binding domain-containing protein [Sandaracinobacteroides sayramensis]
MDKPDSSIRRRNLPPLAALRAFEAAARHLSFRKAAEELAVTPTAISHQIRLLESVLGLSLFDRHIRRISLTGAGAQLFPALRDGLDSFERAIADLYPRSRRQAVTLTATAFFTARRLVPALADFRLRYPQFELRLHASDDVVDLHAGVADVAVRYGGGHYPGLLSEPLSQERFGLVCNPLLAVSGPTDLARVPLIHSEWRRADWQPDWPTWLRKAGLSGIDSRKGLRFTDENHAVDAAIAGQGAAISSLVLLEEQLQRGLLTNPFGPVLEGERYHLLTTAENAACEDVRAVMDWLRRLSGPKPLPQGEG